MERKIPLLGNHTQIEVVYQAYYFNSHTEKKSKMKLFESQLYAPFGSKREIVPISNSNLDNLSIDLLNKSTTANIEKGGIEVQSEELLAASGAEFEFHETFYRVLVPLGSNIQSEVLSRNSVGGNGWERIRNCVLESCMQFDSTIKLWSATRKTSTLYQDLPHTIFYGSELSTENYFKLRRLEIPCSLTNARREIKGAIKRLNGDMADKRLLNWNFDPQERRRLLKILRIASHVTPKAAIKSKNLDKHIRHSLKAELLKNIEINCNNMGLITAAEDTSFRNIIRKFQEPTENNLPLSFTTCYRTSLYATKPTTMHPATMLDSEPPSGQIKKSAGVEFNFVIQNLISAWIKKYDNLHDFSHRVPIKEVLPENTDLDKVLVRRSCSNRAKMIRNESNDVPTSDEFNRMKWKGKRNFEEISIEANILRYRRNATK